MANGRAGQARHRPRRERILDAAVELFRDRGFHAAGIDDIGEAAGISGPGVYRHFPSKQHVLIALFDQILAERIEALAAVRAGGADPLVSLRALVEDHARFALEERALIAVYLQEIRSLPRQEAHRIRREQRRYLDGWVELVRQVRPELDGDEALATVQAAIGVIHSVAFYESALARDQLHALLSRMAQSALVSRSS